MEIYEVYALNIQPSQFKSVLSTDRHTTEGIEEERKNFLGWLKEQWNHGIKYANQVDAWFWYKLFIDFSPLDEGEEIEASWEDEIFDTYMDKVFSNQRNYSEYAGQQ